MLRTAEKNELLEEFLEPCTLLHHSFAARNMSIKYSDDNERLHESLHSDNTASPACRNLICRRTASSGEIMARPKA